MPKLLIESILYPEVIKREKKKTNREQISIEYAYINKIKKRKLLSYFVPFLLLLFLFLFLFLSLLISMIFIYNDDQHAFNYSLCKKKAEYFVKLIEKNLLFSYDFY